MKQVVEKRKDIVFYLKIFPITSIYPKAYDKSRTIVCEVFNKKAMKLLEDAYAKKILSKQTCDTKVIDENIELAKKLGINSTPTFVFDDGRVTSGYMQATQLIRLIEKEQPSTSDNIEIPDDLGEL